MAKRCTLYVGGLVPQVSEEILHAAFIPFGEIKSVQIAKDYVQGGCGLYACKC
jgi:peptidyl-prolyl isomerase E (cyclophilin E)